MEHLMPGFDILVSQVRKTASFYVTSFALFLYHVVFDEHMKCSCKHGITPEVTYNQCLFYMVLPFLILFLLTLWMDGEFQRVLRITCRCKLYLCKRLCAILLKAFAIGFLWVVSVLIDGDWYVCYERVMLPCKNNTTPSQEELEKQLETHFKRQSMVIGLGLVLGLLLMTSILTAVPWMDIYSVICRKCTKYENINDCVVDSTIKTYHMALYEENIKEEIDILIEKDLKITAKESVVLKIRELLQPSSTAAPPTPTTQGGGGATSTTPTTQGEDRPTSTTPTTQGEDRPTSTTPTTQGGGGASSSTTHPDVEDSSSSTAHPEVENRVITLDNLNFDKISKLHSQIISSLFPKPPGAAASTAPATARQPTQGEDRPSSNIIV